MSHPLVGWRTSDQDGWGLRSNLIGRGIFEDFHARSKGNLYSKIATPRCSELTAKIWLQLYHLLDFLYIKTIQPRAGLDGLCYVFRLFG